MKGRKSLIKFIYDFAPIFLGGGWGGSGRWGVCGNPSGLFVWWCQIPMDIALLCSTRQNHIYKVRVKHMAMNRLLQSVDIMQKNVQNAFIERTSDT